MGVRCHSYKHAQEKTLRIPAYLTGSGCTISFASYCLIFYTSAGNLAGRSLVRIVEEELIAVGIIDHQEPVAPRTLLTGTPLASSSARKASSAATAASRVLVSDVFVSPVGASNVWGSTFREMNINALPIFSGHVSAKISAQPCRSTVRRALCRPRSSARGS